VNNWGVAPTSAPIAAAASGCSSFRDFDAGYQLSQPLERVSANSWGVAHIPGSISTASGRSSFRSPGSHAQDFTFSFAAGSDPGSMDSQPSISAASGRGFFHSFGSHAQDFTFSDAVGSDPFLSNVWNDAPLGNIDAQSSFAAPVPASEHWCTDSSFPRNNLSSQSPLLEFRQNSVPDTSSQVSLCTLHGYER